MVSSTFKRPHSSKMPHGLGADFSAFQILKSDLPKKKREREREWINRSSFSAVPILSLYVHIWPETFHECLTTCDKLPNSACQTFIGTHWKKRTFYFMIHICIHTLI